MLGRNLRLGLLDAPIANGQMGHLPDYDDTHMGGGVLYTSSPVLAALFALTDARPVDGRKVDTRVHPAMIRITCVEEPKTSLSERIVHGLAVGGIPPADLPPTCLIDHHVST